MGQGKEQIVNFFGNEIESDEDNSIQGVCVQGVKCLQELEIRYSHDAE